MSDPFISVHILAKENTNLGELFLDSCLLSLKDSFYPNEIILMNNGCNKRITEKLFDLHKFDFKDHGCELKVYGTEAQDFCALRNQCLDATNPNADYVHWIDTDEVYYPEDLDILKNQVLSQVIGKMSVGWSYFYHFMIDPFNVQCDNLHKKAALELDDYRVAKDNIFGYHKGLRWNKEEKVHEHMINLLPNGHIVQTQTEYLHYGYCRQQWRTVTKWLHYDYIKHGHVNHYKVENVHIDPNGVEVPHDTPNSKMIQKEYFRDWRVPNGDFLQDRRTVCTPYPNKIAGIERSSLPQGALDIIGSAKTGSEWDVRINTLDNSDFLQEWVQKYQECNNSWSATLDWVVDEMVKIDWAV